MRLLAARPVNNGGVRRRCPHRASSLELGDSRGLANPRGGCVSCRVAALRAALAFIGPPFPAVAAVVAAAAVVLLVVVVVVAFVVLALRRGVLRSVGDVRVVPAIAVAAVVDCVVVVVVEVAAEDGLRGVVLSRGK